MIINEEDFNKVINEFESNEERGAVYWRAKEIIKNNPEYNIDAILLLLCTWNFAHMSSIFKKVNKRNFSYEKIKDSIMTIIPILEKVRKEDIRTCKLENYKADIERCYEILSSNHNIKGVGASKIMMLLNDNLFVAFDNAIVKMYNKERNRGEKLSIKTGVGYFRFLKLMQEKFSQFKINKNIGFAKAIDEYNYQIVPR